jgi:hypothetical protein
MTETMNRRRAPHSEPLRTRGKREPRCDARAVESEHRAAAHAHGAGCVRERAAREREVAK